MSKKRYVVVGTGGRAGSYIRALVGECREHAELVGFCDLSQTRMDFYNREIAEQFRHAPIPTFPAADFDRMVKQQRPDVVVVCTMDSTHHIYIARAMELGCDVISEKPMTTDHLKARQIFDAIKKTGRSLRVTFNYRYTPHVTKVRELIMQGTIGTPLHADMSWVLDTRHGADYFRRWHREKDKSGGLLVHKATHHFDIINWWVGSHPKTVFAMGDLLFYGRKNAEKRGQKYKYDRYTGAETTGDPFALSLDSDRELRELYLNAEKDTGYIRDRNVFGDNITIEDTMAVTVRYRNGVIFNYSLIAYSPWEGLRTSVTGTKGRIEFYEKHGSHIIKGQDDKELAAAQAQGLEQHLKVFPMFGQPYEVHVKPAEGGHGGADPILMRDLFLPNPPPDPAGRAASHIDGAASIMVGISANQSIATGKPVDVDDLLPVFDGKF